MADEPVLAAIPPNGLHDWATHRIAAAAAPTVYGIGQLIRASAQPGALYIRVSPRGTVWAWRPDNPHRPTAIARAGKLRARLVASLPAQAHFVARLPNFLSGDFWLAANGSAESAPRPRTFVVTDAVIATLSEPPAVFRGR